MHRDRMVDNPILELSRKIVSHAKRQGIFPRKQPCEVCGSSCAVAHHDDYTKPLEVRWLCLSHHQKWHKDQERAGSSASHRYVPRDERTEQWEEWLPADGSTLKDELIETIEKLGVEQAAAVLRVPVEWLRRWVPCT